MYPVRPLLVFCSNLSSRGGKATWLRARSKNKGLQGMGWKPGGKCTRLACLVTREGSKQKVSNRSTRGWKTDENIHQKAHGGVCCAGHAVYMWFMWFLSGLSVCTHVNTGPNAYTACSEITFYYYYCFCFVCMDAPPACLVPAESEGLWLP